MNNFYVYAHLRKDGSPFYVGKGDCVRNRAKSKTGRSKWWKRVVTKDYDDSFPDIVILSEGLDEKTAFALEIYWIALWGRKNVHPSGILINSTDGGEGSTGRKVSQETRQKIANRKRLTGVHRGVNNPNFGKPRSYELKTRLSKLNNAKEAVLIGPQGQIETVQNRAEFCRKYGLSSPNICSVIVGRLKSSGGWKLYHYKE